MRMSAVGVLLVLILAGAGSTFAQTRADSVEFSVYAGRESFDMEGIDDDFFYGARVGWNFTENIELEAYFDTMSTKNDAETVDIDIDNIGIDFIYSDFVPADKHVPYILIGFGTGNVDTESSDGDYDYWEFGIGYRYFYTNTLGVRIDLRTLSTGDDGDFGAKTFDLKGSIGLSFVFGGA